MKQIWCASLKCVYMDRCINLAYVTKLVCMRVLPESHTITRLIQDGVYRWRGAFRWPRCPSDAHALRVRYGNAGQTLAGGRSRSARQGKLMCNLNASTIDESTPGADYNPTLTNSLNAMFLLAYMLFDNSPQFCVLYLLSCFRSPSFFSWILTNLPLFWVWSLKPRLVCHPALTRLILIRSTHLFCNGEHDWEWTMARSFDRFIE